MRFGSLFSGVGGIDLGLERAGMECAWQVEIDDYATKVLAKHWPAVPRFRDVRECGAHNLSAVDLIAGGFPCQDISNAGKRAGIDGERSGLWSEFHRIICELRPRYVLVENVAALLERGMGRVLGDLAASGHDAEWSVLSACSVGAPHPRERVFVVAYPSSDRLQGIKRCCRRHAAFSSQALFAGNEKLLPNAYTNWQEQLSESLLCDVVNGPADHVARNRAGGNACLPQIAQWIGERIMTADRGGQ